jgi:hypothetical protein
MNAVPDGRENTERLNLIDIAVGIVVLGLVFGVFLLWWESPLRIATL